MKQTFRLTFRAQKDLQNIGQYTASQWGKKQRNKYLHQLDQRFFWLADNPLLGKHRSDIKQGYYCYLQGSHLIFYLVNERGIDIIGIPHKAMDITNYFPEH